MRVLVAGADGYLGWPLVQHLAARGHAVGGVDALLRRGWVAEIGGDSAVPVFDIGERRSAYQQHFGQPLPFWQLNLLDYDDLRRALADFQPDTVVHLAEMPSAAYSMIDAAHAAFTQHNNVIGSLNLLWAIKEICPQAHLVKLGTMGEYGAPNVDIPEGFFEIEFRGRRDVLPFPRQAGSFYHWSKVHDSNNTMFACRAWGLRATDIMQGVVFGTRSQVSAADPRLRTRLDFDQCFGTVVNRFCAQAAIGHPLTVFGSGSQTRGFLPLRDSLNCLALVIENLPAPGEYRVVNQFDQCYTVNDIAALVQQAGQLLGLAVAASHYDNPRVEPEHHYYNPDRRCLAEIGYVPSGQIVDELALMLEDLLTHRDRLLAKQDLLIPDIRWDGTQRRSRALHSAGEKHV
ncbi:MAG: NAD-dependent dehydratase [Chloroflexota bacterium]|nr:MAG: NAD-dependent dehydratase [Chloroflexota bacterium]